MDVIYRLGQTLVDAFPITHKDLSLTALSQTRFRLAFLLPAAQTEGPMSPFQVALRIAKIWPGVNVEFRHPGRGEQTRFEFYVTAYPDRPEWPGDVA